MSSNSNAAFASEPLRLRRALGIMALAVIALGLPVNDLLAYALLVVAAVVAFTGTTRARRSLWLAAIGVAVGAALVRVLLAPSPIEEGHNVFLPENPPGVLATQLPPQVYRFLLEQFDARYPAEHRCLGGRSDCGSNQRVDRLYAFSADGIWSRSPYSRAVTAIDFDNPIWLRLGFANDARYNWFTGVDALERVTRNKQVWKGYDRWNFAMPWFVAYKFPAAYAGGELCWRGDVLWEGRDKSFEPARHATMACRTINADDTGKTIFGAAVAPSSLAMKLVPPAGVKARLILQRVVGVAAVLAILLVLVRIDWRRAAMPVALIAGGLAVIAIDDTSFIGGFRPFDGGDDGVTYTGWGQQIAQHLAAGNIREALKGVEAVYYYGGPGLRYLRAIEMFVFGDSNLGYLSLLLILPFIVFRVFRRFFSSQAAWAFALVFTALPLGEVFGTSFLHYAKWAGRGFADPASYIFFLAALPLIIGATRAGPSPKFGAAFAGAFLFAVAIFVKPLVVLACAVMLGGAGLAALYQKQWIRLAGLCLGFAPVFLITLHNWVFGGVFVLFSDNVATSAHTPMPPSAYLEAGRELVSLNFGGQHIRQGILQIANWLAGPSGSFAVIPIHAAAIGLLLWVGIRGRKMDPWLRLVALAALLQHVPALFYAPSQRYYYLAWFLTMLVTAVWAATVGAGWMRTRHPAAWQRLQRTRLVSTLRPLQKVRAKVSP